MLILENLKQKPHLMNCFVRSLIRDKYVYLVSNGIDKDSQMKASFLTNKEAELCKQKFNYADLSFAGVNRGDIIKPLFALKYEEGQSKACVMEYLTFSNDFSKMFTTSTFEEDLTMLAIIVSMTYPRIVKINFPISLHEFSNNECFLKKMNVGSSLTIR